MSRSRPITAARVLLVAAGAVLAVIGFLAVTAAPSLAPQGERARQAVAMPSAPQEPAVKPPARQTPPAAPASPADELGQRAFIDPATGQLREPTPQEAAALAAAARRTLGTLAAPVQLKQGPGGAVGMVVPDNLLSYSVATINPDGTVSMTCVTGKNAADAAVRAPKPDQAGARKEHDHDR